MRVQIPPLSLHDEVVGSIPTWGASLPHSSMVEQAAVNRAVVGSSPTEAGIHCRVDELVSRIALNDEVAGSSLSGYQSQVETKESHRSER